MERWRDGLDLLSSQSLRVASCGNVPVLEEMELVFLESIR